MLPPAFDLDRAVADVHWLVHEVGPRPDGSAAADQAVDGIAARLRAAGWQPQTIGWRGNLVACRGHGGRLLLAHSDTVAESPGAVDNAAGVAVLLELARTSAAADLCLGFPAAEELGLIGAQHLAHGLPEPSWHPADKSIDLVVALDLVGQPRPSTLSANGLGPVWGSDGLRWLLEHTEVDVPYGYRAMSHAAPALERSDHAPFGWAGVSALHLMHRGPHGVFAHYHQPEDIAVSPEALAETAAALEALVTAPTPPAPGADPAFVLAGRVVPGWATWLLVALGIGSGVADLRALPSLPRQLAHALLGVLVTAVLVGLLASTGLLAPTAEEHTAATIMGTPDTGWWTAAPFCTLLGTLAFFGLRWRLGPRGSAPLSAALLSLPLLWISPLVALPVAVGGLLGRLHPALCMLGPLYLLRPDGLRELAFHGLLPPLAWGLLWVLAIPCFGRYGHASPSPSHERRA